MGIVLGANHYGKAETRVFRIVRDTDRHVIRDLNVSTSLAGDFAAAHVDGDQAAVLPTDTQKNTVFAFARDPGPGEIEDFALRLARHFVDDVAPVSRADVRIEEFGVGADRRPRPRVPPHRAGGRAPRRSSSTPTAATWSAACGTWSCSSPPGRSSPASSSTGSRRSPRPTTGSWRRRSPHAGRTSTTAWSATASTGRRRTPRCGARCWSGSSRVHSLALQQSLWEMGRAVLEARPEVASIELVAPNIHHVAVDLSPFGLDNPGEVFHVTDRPYGLIEAVVERDGDG